METKKRITLKDFARETGITTSAISRILNGKETYCSPQKRQEILDLADKWNYKPNIGYRIMTGMSTDITAIIFSQERVTYSECNLRLLVELINRLEEKGYATYSTVMTVDKTRNCEKFLELERKGCRSFIFIGQPVGNEAMLACIQKNSYDYIGMNLSHHISTDPPRKEYDKCFNLNETDAILEYLRIFRENGIENYRLLMPESYFKHRFEPHVNHAELESFRRKLVETPSCEFSSSDGFDARYDNAYSAMSREYLQDPDIRGVICITDYHALGAAHFFHDAGRKVGQDVLVCGMFNTAAARFSLLPIYTANFDMKETASQMLDHLFSPDPIQVAIKPEIIIHRRSRS